jgi:hypothetical protein
MTNTRATTIHLWHFQCPECGMGDEEFGALAKNHDIYCEVCLQDGQHVRLRRWPADEPAEPTEAAQRARAA